MIWIVDYKMRPNSRVCRQKVVNAGNTIQSAYLAANVKYPWNAKLALKKVTYEEAKYYYRINTPVFVVVDGEPKELASAYEYGSHDTYNALFNRSVDTIVGWWADKEKQEYRVNIWEGEVM